MEKEGVIKFNLQFEEERCLTTDMVRELDGWRHVMHRLKLIGQEADRYSGLGFGNISMRVEDESEQFIISGTQTGSSRFLSPDEYSKVISCAPSENSLVAKGMIKPSSEALTHGQLYQLDGAINCVLHTHSPEIWNSAAKLHLPITSPGALYGTKAMAEEVEKLIQSGAVVNKRIFVMGGHEDGVVSFGGSCEEACTEMISALAEAVAVQ